MSDADPRGTTAADRIVLSYRSPDAERDRERWPLGDSDWIRNELIRDSYVGYLRTVHGGEVERGDEWEEFVNRGCGSSADVLLRVEAVVDGTEFGDDTEVEVVHRRDVLAD